MAEKFDSQNVKLATTNATDLYQAPTGNPADRAMVLSCMVANVTTEVTAAVTITITDAAGNVLSTLAPSITIPANATLEVIRNKVVLRQSQKLRATASVANTLEVTVSELEVTV